MMKNDTKAGKIPGYFGRLDNTWSNNCQFKNLEKYITATYYNLKNYGKSSFENRLNKIYNKIISKYNNTVTSENTLLGDTEIRKFFYSFPDSIDDLINHDISMATPFRLYDYFKSESLWPVIDVLREKLRNRITRTEALNELFYCCRSRCFMDVMSYGDIQKVLNSRLSDGLVYFWNSSGERDDIHQIAAYIFIWNRCNAFLPDNDVDKLKNMVEVGKLSLIMYQNTDGGWSADGTPRSKSDIVSTCMVIHALAYDSNNQTKKALQSAEKWLQYQRENDTSLITDPALDSLVIDSILLAQGKPGSVSFSESFKYTPVKHGDTPPPQRTTKTYEKVSKGKGNQDLQKTIEENNTSSSTVSSTEESSQPSDGLAPGSDAQISQLIAHDMNADKKTECVFVSKECKAQIETYKQLYEDTNKNIKEFWDDHGDEILKKYQLQLKTADGKNLRSKKKFEEKLKKCKVLILSATRIEGAIITKCLTSKNGVSKLEGRAEDQQYYQFSEMDGIQIVHLWPQNSSSFTVYGSYNALKKALKRFTPEYVFSVGIAFGANPEEQELGDVLIADHLVFYDAWNKIVDGNIKLSSDDMQSIGSDIFAACPALQEENGPQARGMGSFHWRKGTLLTGGSVISDSVEKGRLMKEANRLRRDVVGGEMEGSGIYFGCNLNDKSIPFTIIKGICDWGINKNGWGLAAKEGEKPESIKDCVQAYACENAFKTLEFIIPKLPIEETDNPDETPIS